MNVLILDLEPREDLPLFQGPRWLPPGTLSWMVKVSKDKLPETVAPFSHVILSGSTDSILDQTPALEPIMRLVREAVDLGRPVLGICYGHQLIAKALLGDAHVRRSETPEMGWLPVRVLPAGKEYFPGLPNPFHTFLAHFDEVCDLPDDWEVIAETDRCAVHGFVNRKLRVLGFQFHPEIDTEVGNACYEITRKESEKAGFDVDQILRETRDDGSGSLLIPHFLSDGAI